MKKVYVAPEVQVVELQYTKPLLDESDLSDNMHVIVVP